MTTGRVIGSRPSTKGFRSALKPFKLRLECLKCLASGTCQPSFRPRFAPDRGGGPHVAGERPDWPCTATAAAFAQASVSAAFAPMWRSSRRSPRPMSHRRSSWRPSAPATITRWRSGWRRSPASPWPVRPGRAGIFLFLAVPFVAWALVIAVSWPIVASREIDFSLLAARTFDTMTSAYDAPPRLAAAWILIVALPADRDHLARPAVGTILARLKRFEALVIRPLMPVRASARRGGVSSGVDLQWMNLSVWSASRGPGIDARRQHRGDDRGDVGPDRRAIGYANLHECRRSGSSRSTPARGRIVEHGIANRSPGAGDRHDRHVVAAGDRAAFSAADRVAGTIVGAVVVPRR